MKDDFFFYEKETGAFKNETRIRVSNIKQKDNSLICIFNNKTNLSISYESLLKKCLSENFFSIIESGSCYSDLTNLSCGKVDCCIVVNPTEELIIEASLYVNSTGGDFKNIKFKECKIFIAGNKFIDKMVIEMVEKNLKI